MGDRDLENGLEMGLQKPLGPLMLLEKASEQETLRLGDAPAWQEIVGPVAAVLHAEASGLEVEGSNADRAPK